MALPVFRRFSIQDIPDAPDWITTILDPLNLFCETTVSALNKNITIGANLQGQVYSTSFTTLAGYATGDFTRISFTYNSNGQPKTCILSKITRDDGTLMLNPVSIAAGWTLNINTNPAQVQVNYIAGLAASTKYNVTFLVL